ncbi:hypothetical protein [Pantoea dispersa]|uniref:hypothetical protein n=1 Tax=Pantoea dispersa TaxID=59814 RepID=UPI0021C767C4|nr:hypothetical protein [Pantoea dispersa]UXO67316.1 hypothetical protein N7977_12615 [Pantoea dispersa]
MRAFNNSQLNVLIDTFGEPLVLTDGSQLTVIFESQTVAIDTAEGFVETQETYLTTKKGLMDYSSTFTYQGKLQVVFNIVDDLSGIINVYFRESM